VMITGRGDVRIAVAAMKAGAADFVEKPFTREAIVDSLNLAKRRLAQPIAGHDSKEAAARIASLEQELEQSGTRIAELEATLRKAGVAAEAAEKA